MGQRTRTRPAGVHFIGDRLTHSSPSSASSLCSCTGPKSHVKNASSSNSVTCRSSNVLSSMRTSCHHYDMMTRVHRGLKLSAHSTYQVILFPLPMLLVQFCRTDACITGCHSLYDLLMILPYS